MQAWAGWSEKWNTWEPAANIETSLIKDYEERQREADEEEKEEALPLALLPTLRSHPQCNGWTDGD